MRGATLLVSFLLAGTTAAAQERCVLRAELDGVISAGAADYLRDALEAAEGRGCEALLIVLDTPGGYLDATRELTRDLLSARVPVIVYVSPAGAHAGSAGVFVTMAAHVAAMAPGTNIGAAHPTTRRASSRRPRSARSSARTISTIS